MATNYRRQSHHQYQSKSWCRCHSLIANISMMLEVGVPSMHSWRHCLIPLHSPLLVSLYHCWCHSHIINISTILPMSRMHFQCLCGLFLDKGMLLIGVHWVAYCRLLATNDLYVQSETTKLVCGMLGNAIADLSALEFAQSFEVLAYIEIGFERIDLKTRKFLQLLNWCWSTWKTPKRH